MLFTCANRLKRSVFARRQLRLLVNPPVKQPPQRKGQPRTTSHIWMFLSLKFPKLLISSRLWETTMCKNALLRRSLRACSNHQLKRNPSPKSLLRSQLKQLQWLLPPSLRLSLKQMPKQCSAHLHLNSAVLLSNQTTTCKKQKWSHHVTPKVTQRWQTI